MATNTAQKAKLGEHIVSVVAQRHARLRRHLSGEDFEKIMSGDYGHQTYRVLGVLIPELHQVMTEYEWEGFANEEEWLQWRETGVDPRPVERADQEDNSPTTDEIVNAFEQALKVNGAGRLGKIIDLATMLQSAQPALQAAQEARTDESPASLGSSGE